MVLTLYSSGSNACGQLAHDTREDAHTFRASFFADIEDRWADGSKIVSVAAGANHTLVLVSSEGESILYGCGDGRRGQLGTHFTGSAILRRISCDRFTGGEITAIAAAWETSFVVVSFGDRDVLFSVGANDFGDLGVGGLSSGQKETREWQSVDFKHMRPREATEMRILRLRSGPHHALAQLRFRVGDKDVDILAGWGAARHGQLGPTPKSDSFMARQEAVVMLPREINLDCALRDFAAGSQHSVFLSEEGSVFAIGSNRKGQIENLRSAPRGITKVAATWNGTYLVQTEGKNSEDWAILATGSNSHCQLAAQPSVNDSETGLHKLSLVDVADHFRVLNLVCGSEHILLAIQKVDVNHSGCKQVEVYGWGWNEHGNLGLGHTNDSFTPCRLFPYADECGSVTGIWAGCATSWIAVES